MGYSGSVLSASQIIRAKNDGFYLLTDSTVERFNNVGEFQWSQPLSARPQALDRGQADHGAQRQHGAGGHTAGADSFQRTVTFLGEKIMRK